MSTHEIPEREPLQPELDRANRILAALGGAGLIAALVMALVLRPASAGYGTHRQLGLPPCTWVVLTGERCPTCGMTTAWACAVRGQWKAALAANVGGTLLCLMAVVVAPLLLWVAIRGHRPRWLPRGKSIMGFAVAIAMITLTDWLLRLVGFSW